LIWINARRQAASCPRRSRIVAAAQPHRGECLWRLAGRGWIFPAGLCRLSACRARALGAGAGLAKTFNFRGLSLLIADDSACFRSLLLHVCRGFGFEAHMTAAVANGSDALVHQLMPELDGIEFLRRIRGGAVPGLTRMPVILLSGFANYETVTAARDAGASEVLVKPASPEQVLSRIVACFERERSWVEAGELTIPDRRRTRGGAYDGVERRGRGNPDQPLSQDAVNRVMREQTT
jgi:CheY-like chemotaxis protein